MTGSILKYARQFAALTGGVWTRGKDFYTLTSALGGVNYFYPLLGGRKGTEEGARSFSAAGALMDEATLLDVDFTNTVMDRCSKPGAKVVMVMNPSGPMHPIKTNWIDVADRGDPDVMHIPFNIADNHTLTPQYVRGLIRRYHGFMKLRMIYGEWAASEGLIYPNIGDAIGSPPCSSQVISWTMGIDWAHASETHALLIGRLQDRTQWVYDEWVHNGQERGELSSKEQARRIYNWLHSKRIRCSRANIDPSALAFISRCREKFPFKVTGADNDVLNGIQYVRTQTEEGQLRLSKHCTRLNTQMYKYHWDERMGLLGEDKPVKVDDHGPDGLRYDQWTGAKPTRRRVSVSRGRRL